MLTTQTPPRDVTIPSTGGVALRGWHWSRPNPRAVLVVSHGFGEHGGCYRHVAEALAPALDVDLLAFDFRGHGRSHGRRGVVKRYDDLVEDLLSALAWCAKALPHVSTYVLGHSNGGQVALRAALRPPENLAGLILTNPVIALATRVPSYKVWAGHLLLRVAPWVTLPASLPTGQMTRDPAMQHEHDIDPLRHSRMSAPLFFGMIDGGPMLTARAGEIRTPVLIILGTSDVVIDPKATHAFYDALGSTDKALLIYPKMLHEPLNELGREQVFSDIIAWLGPRLPALDA
jgi:alpha-beta hydrolase superfamily lysophospholipase